MLRTSRCTVSVLRDITDKRSLPVAIHSTLASLYSTSTLPLTFQAQRCLTRREAMQCKHHELLHKGVSSLYSCQRHSGFAVHRVKPDITLGQFKINPQQKEYYGIVNKVDDFGIEKVRAVSWRLDEYLRRVEHHIQKQGFFFLPTFFFQWYKGCLPLYSSYQIRMLYNRHHRAHVNKLNELIEGTPFYGMQLDEIIQRTHNNDAYVGIYNHAAQHFNFCFFWKNIEPYGSNIPPDLCAAITAQYGSVDAFQERFVNAALNLFGSGWVYLIYDKSSELFDILSLSNAGCPLVNRDHIPMLCVNVWEHAYYIDYENNRAEYLSKFFDVADWHWAERYWKRGTNQKYNIIDYF